MTRPQTIPDFFWQSMGEPSRSEVSRVVADGHTVYASGSRLFCPAHARSDSDWDVAFRCETGYLATLYGRGFEDGGSQFGRHSFRLGSLNLCAFLPHDSRQFRLFMAATTICHLLGGPVEKPARVALFEAIRVAYFQDGGHRLLAELGIAADELEDRGGVMCENLREIVTLLDVTAVIEPVESVQDDELFPF